MKKRSTAPHSIAKPTIKYLMFCAGGQQSLTQMLAFVAFCRLLSAGHRVGQLKRSKSKNLRKVYPNICRLPCEYTYANIHILQLAHGCGCGCGRIRSLAPEKHRWVVTAAWPVECCCYYLGVASWRKCQIFFNGIQALRIPFLLRFLLRFVLRMLVHADACWRLV